MTYKKKLRKFLSEIEMLLVLVLVFVFKLNFDDDTLFRILKARV